MHSFINDIRYLISTLQLDCTSLSGIQYAWSSVPKQLSSMKRLVDYSQWCKFLQASTKNTEVVGARTQRELPSVCVTSRSAVRLVKERRHTMSCLASTKPATRARALRLESNVSVRACSVWQYDNAKCFSM